MPSHLKAIFDMPKARFEHRQAQETASSQWQCFKPLGYRSWSCMKSWFKLDRYRVVRNKNKNTSSLSYMAIVKLGFIIKHRSGLITRIGTTQSIRGQ